MAYQWFATIYKKIICQPCLISLRNRKSINGGLTVSVDLRSPQAALFRILLTQAALFRDLHRPALFA